MEEQALKLIRKLALLNAVKFKGKANPGAVSGGILSDFPDLKKDMKALMTEINRIISDVNSMGFENQQKELAQIDPWALQKKEHKEADIFAFMGIKEGDKVVTGFPPGPEKYPHIGHAKSMLMNLELAKKYSGKFILRFEDTNPELVKKEFYQIMINDFKWLGATWDELVYASDYMEFFYEKCLELLEKGDAFVCTCPQESIGSNRAKLIECGCRSRPIEENKRMWFGMPNMEPGSAIVRIKIDMSHKNPTMRDPGIFRINKTPHARTGSRYSVWPTYDFQNSLMDAHFGVTHRVRGKEWEMRQEVQHHIQRMFGFKETYYYEYGRFNFEGVESSGRKIREKINSGEIVGWDDPSLTTLAALRRRGFQPEAIREFVLKTGLSKNDARLTWDDLIVHNKRLLDAKADRYFFVWEPIEISIVGAPKKKFELNLHPDLKHGGRRFETHDKFYISARDNNLIEDGKLYRLMECLNFRREKGVYSFADDKIETYRLIGEMILHYLPVSPELVKVKVLMPDKKLFEGFAEPGVKNVQEGQVIQFERFGFVRLDSKETMTFWFTH